MNTQRTDGGSVTGALPRKPIRGKPRISPQTYEANARFVYVIQRGDQHFCKVGISKSVRRRLSGLQVSTPDKLKLVFSLKPTTLSALAVEGAALRLLEPWKAGGEWVSCHPFIAQKVVEAVAAGQEVSSFLDLLQERVRRWAAVKEAQDQNTARHQDDATSAAFSFYQENERACWEARVDIMRVIDPWGAASYDPEDIGYQRRLAELARPRRRKVQMQ